MMSDLRQRLGHGGHLRVVVAGSRTFLDYEVVKRAIETAMALWQCDLFTVVSGGEPNGVDALGERWAREHGHPCIVEPADWDRHGRAAGPIRNRRMAEMTDALVAVWDGRSPGTKNMIEEAAKRGRLLYVVRV